MIAEFLNANLIYFVPFIAPGSVGPIGPIVKVLSEHMIAALVPIVFLDPLLHATTCYVK